MDIIFSVKQYVSGLLSLIAILVCCIHLMNQRNYFQNKTLCLTINCPGNLRWPDTFICLSHAGFGVSTPQPCLILMPNTLKEKEESTWLLTTACTLLYLFCSIWLTCHSIAWRAGFYLSDPHKVCGSEVTSLNPYSYICQ